MSSPQQKAKPILRKQAIMRRVMIASVPCIAGSVYFFGWRSLAVVAVSCLFGFLTEYLFCRSRAYSISSDPADEGFIELIVRLVPNGICTTYMFEHLRVGDPVRINGPYGDFRLADTDAPIVFVAGGSGMVPIKSILHGARGSGGGSL